VTDAVIQATVLFSDIRNFTPWPRSSIPAKWPSCSRSISSAPASPLLKNGGRHLKFIGDGMMTVFTDTMSGSPLPAARRAVSAALAHRS